MKNILLLGDSIRLGHCGHVKEVLKNVDHVHYPTGNYRYTLYTFVQFSEWMNLAGDPNPVDAIQWNNGHWVAVHWLGEERALNTPEQYESMLERIYRYFIDCFLNAKIIFATTTPMNPYGSNSVNPRITANIMEYNKVARTIMKKLDLPVNDLFSLMTNQAC